MHPERLLKKNRGNTYYKYQKKADRLIKNGLNFRYIRKSVLYFQKADPRTTYYRYYKIGREKPKIYENRLPIYKIYEKNHHTNNHTYNILIYKVRKGRRCLYDLIKYGNYINIDWKNKHKTSSPSCRYKKMIIITLIGKRFERKKKAAILLFKKIII